MQQLQCPLGYYWNGQLCLPLGVQGPSTSKFISWLDYLFFDALCSTAGIITLLVVVLSLVGWYFRATLQAAWRSTTTTKGLTVDQWAAAATAALLRAQASRPDAPPNGSRPEY